MLYFCHIAQGPEDTEPAVEKSIYSRNIKDKQYWLLKTKNPPKPKPNVDKNYFVFYA